MTLPSVPRRGAGGAGVLGGERGRTNPGAWPRGRWMCPAEPRSTPSSADFGLRWSGAGGRAGLHPDTAPRETRPRPPGRTLSPPGGLKEPDLGRTSRGSRFLSRPRLGTIACLPSVAGTLLVGRRLGLPGGVRPFFVVVHDVDEVSLDYAAAPRAIPVRALGRRVIVVVHGNCGLHALAPAPTVRREAPLNRPEPTFETHCGFSEVLMAVRR